MPKTKSSSFLIKAGGTASFLSSKPPAAESVFSLRQVFSLLKSINQHRKAFEDKLAENVSSVEDRLETAGAIKLDE